MQPLLDRFKGKPLAEIGQAEIDLAAAVLKPGCAPATLNRHIYTPISAVLNYAASQQPPWCAKPSIKRPKFAEGRVRWITHEEADRLIAAAKPHLKPLVIFLLGTGARISEALYLDWKEVDLVRGHVVLYGPANGDDNSVNTKNGEPRGVPLHPRVIEALTALPHRTGAVFRKPTKGRKPRPGHIDRRRLGEPYPRRIGGGGVIKSAWATMCKKARISNFTPHDCRHTWATWHYMANRDVAKLMELGGWKSLDMVMRYTHINKDHLRGSIEAMWG